MSKTIIEQATPRLANSENGVLTDRDGDEPRDFHWQDTWLYAQASMGVACRAYGWRPIDGSIGDFCDPGGYKAEATRGAILGFERKKAIHPSQVELANEVFSPSEAEGTKARRIMEAMAQATCEGKMAVSLDGPLIDIVAIKMAENLLAKPKQIAGS